MTTQPTSLSPPTVADRPAALDHLRVGEPAEILALMRRLCDDRLLLELHPNGGPAAGAAPLVARLLTLDAANGRLTFGIEPAEHGGSAPAEPLRSGDRLDAMVVCLVDRIRIEFMLHGAVGRPADRLTAALPAELWRFQRRGGYRVRSLPGPAPVARLRHPSLSDMRLELPVLDISISGCALVLPADVPALEPGVQLNGVQLQLDADTRLVLALRLLHVTRIDGDAAGARLGCEWLRPGRDDERALQRYVDHTQQRRRLMALDAD